MPIVVTDFSDDVYHDLDEDTDTYIDNDSNDNPEFREKEKQILAALSSEPADTERLKQLAISPEGLLTDELRKLAWPKLINIDVDNILLKPGKVMLQICYHVIFVTHLIEISKGLNGRLVFLPDMTFRTTINEYTYFAIKGFGPWHFDQHLEKMLF